MKRVRLTQRRREAAEFVDYPGTVNQPDRTFKADDKYENEDSWMVDGWELQDLPTRFDDKRNEMNIPDATTEPSQSRKAKVAATRNAASKAVRLAMLLLGDKVPEKVIEGQAHDFMRLGGECLTNALKRYAATEKLYAKKSEDEEVEAEDDEEEVVETGAKKKKKKAEDDEKVAEEEEVVEETGAKKKKKKSEDDEEEVVEETGAKKKKKSDDDEDEDDEVEVVETGAKKKKKKAEVEIEVEDDEDEGEDEEDTGAKKKKKKAEDEDAEAEEDTGAKKKKSEDEPEKKRAGELDIEMTAAEGEVEMSADERAVLASLYADSEPGQVVSSDDEDEDDEIEIEEQPKKAGVQKLGGQPKVASSGGEVDLGSLWKDAPDLGSVFSS